MNRKHEFDRECSCIRCSQVSTFLPTPHGVNAKKHKFDNQCRCNTCGRVSSFLRTSRGGRFVGALHRDEDGKIELGNWSSDLTETSGTRLVRDER
jgi:hypothetical protein